MTEDAKVNTNIDLRELILNANEPLVMRNALIWELVQWDVTKWATVLKDEKLPFRCGRNACTKDPQFENTTQTLELTFEEFIKHQKTNLSKWLYFDYKYLREWLLNKTDIQKCISWKDFGFPELSFEDSTIWIGSQGSHTPCHKDTYGCNIVTQIYGRKRWILFPPSEDLHPTRIPYEESSIYSQLNFFSPTLEECKGITNCFTTILNPGDVLILPHRWWHYVENLDLAISINTWIKLPDDHEERIKESIVRFLISQLTKGLSLEKQHAIINPASNEDNNITLTEENPLDSITIIDTCLNCYKKENVRVAQSTDFNFNKVQKKFPNIKVVERLADIEFQLLLEQQNSRFETEEIALESPQDEELKRIINALLHDDVVNLVKQKLLNK